MNMQRPEELAKELGVDAHTLTRWRTSGTGPAYLRVGRQVRYRRDDVEAWLETRRTSTREQK